MSFGSYALEKCSSHRDVVVVTAIYLCDICSRPRGNKCHPLGSFFKEPNKYLRSRDKDAFQLLTARIEEVNLNSNNFVIKCVYFKRGETIWENRF